MKNKKMLAMLAATAIGVTGVQVAIAETVEVIEVFGNNSRIIIDADTDFDGDHKIPVIAKVGESLGIHLNQEGYKLRVVGANGNILAEGNDFKQHNDKHEISDSKVNDKNKCKKCKDDKMKYYTWKPTKSGIFTLQVTKGNESDKVLTSRKIYINDTDLHKYYQFKDAGFKTIEVEPQITTSSVYEVTTPQAYTIVDPEQVVFGVELHEQTEGTTPEVNFTVGEELFWKRTIREEAFTNDSKQYYIKETNHFNLDRGTYTFWADVRGLGSIEAEDFKKRTYTRRDTGEHPHEVTLNVEVIDDKLVAMASCSQASQTPDELGCKMTYAFLMQDDLGTRVMKDYGETVAVQLPSANWDYTIQVRAKHMHNSSDDKVSFDLPNAYEAVANYDVKGAEPTARLKIDEVEIEIYSLTKYYEDINKGTNKDSDENKPGFVKEIDVEDNRGYVYANNKNYIELDVEAPDLKSKDTLHYEAWVIDSGVTIPLEIYKQEQRTRDDDYEAKFVYYPKSGGSASIVNNDKLANETHKLVVAVKQMRGTEIVAQTSKEIELQVKNFGGTDN